ncbi:hypothetical protein BY458DRAFT_559261 [Sporodiniella umbellata]|nr:hypothetical protein BY458DRAFT_559261 [Sporodiniella umbellata]
MEWNKEIDSFYLETLTLQKHQQAQPPEQEWMSGELDETMIEQEHKEYTINLYDQNLQTRVVDFVDSLTKSFENFSLKEISTRNFIKTECNFSLKRAALDPTEQKSEDKPRQCFEWVERWTSTDIDYLSNCVVVDENGFDMNMRLTSA